MRRGNLELASVSPISHPRREPETSLGGGLGRPRSGVHSHLSLSLMSRILAFTALVAVLAVPASAQTLADYYDNPQASTEVPLTPADRQPSIDALQATLYELAELKHDTHQSHWNVVGQNFYALHDLLGEIYQRVEGLIDVVAERKRALGAAADARPVAIAQSANLPVFPDGLLADSEVPALLSDRYYTVVQRNAERLKAIGDADPSSQDVLIDVARELEKDLWMLRAFQLPNGGSR